MFFKRYTERECAEKIVDLEHSIAYYQDLMLDAYEKQIDSAKVSKIILKLEKELKAMNLYADTNFDRCIYLSALMDARGM